MGRPSKPTSLKLLDGDRASRINTDEPTPSKGATPCPDYLTPLAREAWARIVPILDGMGVLTEADCESLALYCHAYATWRAAIAATGSKYTVETETTIKVNPLVQVANDAHRQMMRILSEFGMTPSARASLKVAGKPEDDALLTYFGNRSKASDGQDEAAEG